MFSGKRIFSSVEKSDETSDDGEEQLNGKYCRRNSGNLKSGAFILVDE